VQRDHPHAGTAIPLTLDEVLLLEANKRGADRCSPDAERLGQVGLDKPLVRLEAAGDDCIVQQAVGLVGRAGGRSARCSVGAQAVPPALRQPPPA
jgi:hypothetical protein